MFGAVKRSGMALAIAALLTAGPVLAQTAENLTFFRDVNAKVVAPAPETIAALLKGNFATIAQKNPMVCVPTSITVSDIKPATADANVSNAVRNGKMLNGWTARADMAGCPVGFANYLVIRLPDEAGAPVLRAISFSRGRTLAGYSITKDAMHAAMESIAGAFSKAKIDTKGCSGPIVVGVRDVVAGGNPGPDVFGVRFVGNWTEKWEFHLCGYAIAIPIHFSADGQGGASLEAAANDAEVKRL